MEDKSVEHLRAVRGVAVSLILGICAMGHSALAQDAPKLRTIERQRVENVPAPRVDTQVQAAAVLDTIAKDDAGSVAAKSGAAQAAAVDLPRSDIALPRLAPLTKDAKKKLAQSVQAAMKAKAVRQTTIGMQVVDLDTGEVVYAKQAEKYLKPASNTKLVTTAAALGILGPDHQFESALLARGKVKDGVVNGDLQLHIDHDFTWSTRFYNTGDTPMVGLVQQLKAAGIKKITGNLIVSGYVVYGGMATNTLSTTAHLQSAARQFAAIMKKNGIAYKGLVVRQSEKREGAPLATWKSPVLAQAIVPLNRVSHNEYADMLLLAIAAKNGKNTYEAGAKAELAWLESIGIETKNVRLNDGSGLSHDNRVSPKMLTDLTAWVLKESSFGREWAASLSISGYDGTYGGRLANDDGKGRVYAKSGTLRDVISGSGFFVNRYDGHTYAFSVIVNGSRNRKLTRQAIDRMVMPFLGNFRSVQRVAAPVFSSYRKEADGRVVARWNPVAKATGYRVYSSVDGAHWSVAAETKDTVLIMPDSARHLRLSAVLPDGAESAPSLIYSYRPGERSMAIVEMAQCRSDEAMRPASHFVSHEMPLAQFVGDSWGVFTTSQSVDNAQGALFHTVACQGKMAWNDEAYRRAIDAKMPIIVDAVDAHQSTQTQEACDPRQGKVLGCYAEAVVTKDRRFGDRRENLRLRKAAGTGSSRPSAIGIWKGAKSVGNMADATVMAREKSANGSDLAIVGIDLQALDSQKALQAAWKLVGND